MKYDEYLAKVLKDDCPFCNLKEEYLLEKGKYFSVIMARAPYIQDHLLIVPNRHLVYLKEMTKNELSSLMNMLNKWTKKLEKIHKEINILLRDWVANGIAWKSINHLHFHLIPDCPVFSKNSWGDRVIYSERELIKKTQDLKDRLHFQ